jgi:hypothetical protein
MGGRLEDDKQRDQGKRRDHQQLVVIDVGDDLGLLRDHRVGRRAAGGGERIPELRNGRVVERPIDGADVDRQVGVVDLGIRGQERIDDRNADARADFA